MKWMVAIFVAAMLAGCSDGEKAADEVGETVVEQLEVPTWSVGKWWSYTDSQGQTYNLVVAEDTGKWQVLVNDINIALMDARIDISFIGPHSKAQLAGEQQGTPIKFFDFPLEHQKTWQTTWDGATRDAIATASGEGYFITVSTGEQVFAEYTFDVEAGFFGEMTFYNETNGEVSYQMELTGFGDDFTGTAFRYTSIEQIADVTATAQSMGQTSFPIQDVTELAVVTTITCRGGGTGGIGLQEPQENGQQQPLPPSPIETNGGPAVYGYFGPCPAADGVYVHLVPEPRNGQWRIDGVAPGNGEASMTVEARIYDTLSF